MYKANIKILQKTPVFFEHYVRVLGVKIDMMIGGVSNAEVLCVFSNRLK